MINGLDIYYSKKKLDKGYDQLLLINKLFHKELKD